MSSLLIKSMNNYLLILNAGSSSIKFALFKIAESAELLVDASGQLDGIGIQPCVTVTDSENRVLVSRALLPEDGQDHSHALKSIQTWLDEYLNHGNLAAVGHRVVHGGSHYIAPVLVNAAILTDLEKLISLAPLHQPHNLAPIKILLETQPNLAQVACFDTAFHNTQPDVAKRLALPRYFAEEGLCRYGFHGLSYEYIASVIPALDPDLQEARIIVAHLGNGASLCALKNRKSIATTMGFSPLDGLVMGTRCGNLDPGVLLYLMERHGMDVHVLTKLLYHQSGLLGVSGLSSDMRVLLESDNPNAKEAIELFVYRVIREIGSLVAALGGLDALIFTGGIGEHAPAIREKICGGLTWLGLELNHSANHSNSSRISTPNSKVSLWIVPTNENLMIAQQTLNLITLQ